MIIYPNYERIQRLRTARGLTQADLAALIQLPASAFSRVLSEQLPIGADSALQLADALGCSPAFLDRPISEAAHTRPWLRAYADAPKKAVEQHIADTLLALECVVTLSLKQMPERLPVFTGDLNDDNEIDEFAIEVREAADVSPEGPVPNVTRAAERLGCVVLPMDNELGRHLGMSFFIDDTPVIRVSRPSGSGGIPGDRQRFTLAHELGHLTLHSSSSSPETADQAKAIEKQAHRFAAAFLLPGDCFLGDLDNEGGRVTLSTLSRLKQRWGVAIKAMVVRLQQLNCIDVDQARSLYKQISARGWNRNEPMPVGNEDAIWLTKALSRRFQSEDPVAEAAERTGLWRSYFDAWTCWKPNEDATVIQFPPRSEVSDEWPDGGPNGSVTPL